MRFFAGNARRSALTLKIIMPLGIVACFVGLSSAAEEKVPTLPITVIPPKALTLACIDAARTLPALDYCRATFEAARGEAEEYNKRIARFCKSLISFDAKLREKASKRRITWDDYEDLKEVITSELQECDAKVGDYYAPYREQIRVYKQAIDLVRSRRDAIVKVLEIQ